MSGIPQSSPGAGYQARRAEIDDAVRRVMESGWYILGEEVTAFESEFAAYLGAGMVAGVASGTDAVELALRACGVGEGDAVFTVSHTAVATVAAIERCGAVPVLVDITPDTYTLDPERLEAAVERATREPERFGRPRAIVVVHLYGQMAEMRAIMPIAERHGLLVVEDCAQAHGARLGGRLAGSWGAAASFSFYPTKNLGALGDGGAVSSSDPGLGERVRLLRQYGWRERYISDVPGMNSRLDELQAAILRVKLRHLDEENARRRDVARRYDEALAEGGLAPPVAIPGAEHVYHQYVVRTPERDALRRFLAEREIGTAIHYPVPVHLQPAYAGRLPLPEPLTVTETVAAEVLSLPMFPELADAAVARVATALAEWHRVPVGAR
jgi:dTDP-4-amino-4,6-dideoxygalactose transaminase